MWWGGGVEPGIGGGVWEKSMCDKHICLSLTANAHLQQGLDWGVGRADISSLNVFVSACVGGKQGRASHAYSRTHTRVSNFVSKNPEYMLNGPLCNRMHNELTARLGVSFLCPIHRTAGGW